MHRWTYPLVDVGNSVGQLCLQNGLTRPLLSALYQIQHDDGLPIATSQILRSTLKTLKDADQKIGQLKAIYSTSVRWARHLMKEVLVIGCKCSNQLASIPPPV